MKIAVTYENGQIFQHFGKSKQWKVYEVENGRSTTSCILDVDAEGHTARVQFLVDHHIDTVVCGGIGGPALAALKAANIIVYPGHTGDADAVVEQVITGAIVADENYTPHTCHHGKN